MSLLRPNARRCSAVFATALLVVLARSASAEFVNVSPSDFSPSSNTGFFLNGGDLLRAEMGAVARVPLPPNINVNKVTLYAFDDDPTHDVKVELHKQNTVTGKDQTMASVNSTGADPAVRPRAFSTTAIAHNPTDARSMLYLKVTFEADAPILLFRSARVSYSFLP